MVNQPVGDTAGDADSCLAARLYSKCVPPGAPKLVAFSARQRYIHEPANTALS